MKRHEIAGIVASGEIDIEDVCSMLFRKTPPPRRNNARAQRFASTGAQIHTVYTV
jgi:hypothetical protein